MYIDRQTDLITIQYHYILIFTFPFTTLVLMVYGQNGGGQNAGFIKPLQMVSAGLEEYDIKTYHSPYPPSQ